MRKLLTSVSCDNGNVKQTNNGNNTNILDDVLAGSVKQTPWQFPRCAKHIYIYIYIYIYNIRESSPPPPPIPLGMGLGRLDVQDSWITSPENSRRFPEIFEDVCKNKTSFLWVFVEKRFLPFAPVSFRRKPEPVPRTRVLSQNWAGAHKNKTTKKTNIYNY